MSPEVDFAITERVEEDGTPVVAVAGELDLYRVPALEQALGSASGSAGVIIDLREATFIDSSTVAFLVQEHLRLQEAGRELVVLVGEHTPTTVFTLTEVDRILAIQYAGSADEQRSSVAKQKGGAGSEGEPFDAADNDGR
jgi:anti-sigma B factor antagonist